MAMAAGPAPGGPGAVGLPCQHGPVAEVTDGYRSWPGPARVMAQAVSAAVSAAQSGDAVLAHGLLLIADQLTAAGQGLVPILDGALRELMRAQTVELP